MFPFRALGCTVQCPKANSQIRVLSSGGSRSKIEFVRLLDVLVIVSYKIWSLKNLSYTASRSMGFKSPLLWTWVKLLLLPLGLNA